MKTDLIIYSAAIMAALSAVSCSKELQDVTSGGDGAGKVELLIPAEEATKTVFGDGGYEVKWNDDDRIGVFVGTSSNVPASLTRIGGKAYWTATVDSYAAGEKLYAYYPYDAKAGTDAGKLALQIPSQQKQQAADVFNGTYSPMAAVPVTLSDAETSLEQPLKFRHTAAVLEFDITNVPSDETLKSVQFVPDGGYPATDNAAYDVTSVTEDGDIVTTAGTYYKSVTVSVGNVTPGQTSKVYMALVPGTYNGNIYISTDRNLYRYSGKDIAADRAFVKTIKADLSGSTADKSKEIKSALDYEAFACAANAGDCSAWVDGDGEVKLGADMTSKSYFTRVQTRWTGKFNGQGHTLIQENSIVPLFTVIGEGAYVKNLVLEGKTTSVAYAASYGNAAIARINYGTIENITNRIVTDMTVTMTSDAAISGIVKCNAGLVKDCTQEGAITVHGQTSDSKYALYAGGIACFASDSDDYSKATKCGRFENCTNKAAIKITKKSDKAVSYSQHCAGGICAIVHNGSKADFAEFKGCHNTGYVSSVDDPSSKSSNGASAVGGIVGRIGNYSTQYNTKLAFDIQEGKGFYAKVEDCHNSGTVENGVISNSSAPAIGSQSGARTACAGGIAGYANGLKDALVEISGCTDDGVVKGGAWANCVLGGICGETNNVAISECTVTTRFNDSETSAHQLSAAGGLVGVSLLTLTVNDCFVDMSGTLTSSPAAGIGVLQGYVKSGTAAYSDIRIRANLTYGDSKSLTVTEDNVSDTGLYGPSALETSGVTYWNK